MRPLGLPVVPLVYIFNVWSHWKRVSSRGEEKNVVFDYVHYYYYCL